MNDHSSPWTSFSSKDRTSRKTSPQEQPQQQQHAATMPTLLTRPLRTVARIDEGFHQSHKSSSSCRLSLVDSVHKIDFLTELPMELAMLILSFCDPKALWVLLTVSRRWHRLSRDDLLWREHYFQNWPPARLEKGIDYRSLYQRRSLLDQRWRKGRNTARCIVGHSDSIYCVQFDAHKIVTGSRDRTIKFWDMHGQCVRTLLGHHASVLCLQYNDAIMVSGSSDHSILVWSMTSYDIIRRIHGHSMGVLDVCFDDVYIASCSKDSTIRIWNRHDGTCVRTLQGHRGPVNAIQFKGSRLVSASGDAVIKLWDIETGQCVRNFIGHSRGLACIRFDGRRIVSGSNDNKIKVWDAETGQCTLTCEGHTGLVRALHFDDKKIVSGGYDQSIRVWDIKTGDCLVNYQCCHSSWVFDVMFNETKIIRQVRHTHTHAVCALFN
ncbi:hypothetical protein DFQ30_001204 [Apophysomyces sp. BC1015]|nr:hypothetical protein DFQ30_001204 [Apophysomyces sp. BC1015]KAG0181350.1 hypothetical protein DFQ29_008620 [Apophysomyces sp. BC1021]